MFCIDFLKILLNSGNTSSNLDRFLTKAVYLLGSCIYDLEICHVFATIVFKQQIYCLFLWMRSGVGKLVIFCGCRRYKCMTPFHNKKTHRTQKTQLSHRIFQKEREKCNCYQTYSSTDNFGPPIPFSDWLIFFYGNLTLYQ